ncbi:enoyl-CoA hydratase [Yoonia sediminilitoris]|uniref:Enoyl-CoA hydratase domain-containing protein 3, mitochondrial n=1 Tax=Yoonia sediminilitoris TaxID=1286148 RepID=A0A2T6KLK9_9RHOB|nr:enoyl-CoA hydratase [Yoonia sediminilitoris]PUB17081.1 enoyl-CoA hydratase/carnithine racemase [Yoonia sediminilitoris]RCW97376.1 enoyl-CoA hydratase/carnithine racemase [Yoonia sediminilitoris]
MTTPDILLRELDARGILRLTLNDVARRNALSEAMLATLRVAFEEAGSDPAVRVIVLAANGPAFCAGHDLKEMTAGRAGGDGGKTYFAHVMFLCASVMQGIVNCPKPVIAEVTGVATAAGCQLVASCDLAIAADTAKFSTPGVHIGLFCSTPMVALSRNVADKHAMEMLLTGDMTSAVRAAEIGLVNRAVAPEALQDTVIEMACKIASKSSMTLATGKRAYYAQREMTLPEAYEYASGVMVDNMLAQDAREGIGAFIEKRAPEWQDA